MRMALPKMTANYFVGFSHSNSCRPISSIKLALKDVFLQQNLLFVEHYWPRSF